MTMGESIRCARIGGPQANADGLIMFEYCFPANDPTFAGHFPTRPLLPGVYQLELARQVAEAVSNRHLTIQEITKARFLRPIIPAETVRVALKLVNKSGTIQARASFTVTGQPAGEVILLLI